MEFSKEENNLYSDVCGIIENARSRVAVYVNSEVCLTKWHVGKRIKEDVLYNQRAEYGKQIVKNLAAKLTAKYGGGWSYGSLLHCIRAAYTFTEDEIRYAVRIQFTWTHIRSLMFVENSLARQFYMEMCRVFLEWTKSIWTMNTESAKKVKHPAPFPEELPHRLINLYSFQDDIILDPFMGSGTTAVAALKNNRFFVGYEISSDYKEIADIRISNAKSLFNK